MGVLRRKRHIPSKNLPRSSLPPGRDTHSKFPPPREITNLDLPSLIPPSSHTMFYLPKQREMSLSAGTDADNYAKTGMGT